METFFCDIHDYESGWPMADEPRWDCPYCHETEWRDTEWWMACRKPMPRRDLFDELADIAHVWRA